MKMECPWCGSEVQFQPSRKTTECSCGTIVYRDGTYRLKCPVCSRHHEGGREGATRCMEERASWKWLQRLAALISTVPYSPEGSREPLDLGGERYWYTVSHAVMKRDANKCTECGASTPLEVHHIIPRWAGGTDHPSNLRILCYECHKAVHMATGGYCPSQAQREVVAGKQRTLKEEMKMGSSIDTDVLIRDQVVGEVNLSLTSQDRPHGHVIFELQDGSHKEGCGHVKHQL